MLADAERREDPWGREAGAHGIAQVAVGELDAGAGVYVGRDRAERDAEIREAVPADGPEPLEDPLEMLAREEPRSRHVEVRGQVEQPRQDPHDTEDVPDPGCDLLELRGGEPERVMPADDCSHARADDHVDGDPLALEHVEHADVCESPRGAASERESDASTARETIPFPDNGGPSPARRS